MTALRLLVLCLVAAAGVAQAAGPLALSTETGTLKPLAWDTRNGPIPVYTDGGEAFTYDFDEVTPFITIERANELTAFAFNEWSKVPTSTFKAEIADTIAAKLGIADVTAANAGELVGVRNGTGFWVLYDTDGSLLEEFFGVPRSAVLGIGFPEFSDGNGHIVEATAVMNGWNVHDNDIEGRQVAGVFTHEFGHAINLSHSQVNGHLAYQSSTYAPQYPGPKDCVAPLHRYDHPDEPGVSRADPAIIETMFPFLRHADVGGIEQSTIDHPDDIASISNLYPTADYLATRGAISGVLRLKDGTTQYAGINVIARNVDNPLFDAMSDMTGSQTQGQLGPDGRFTLANLTPGAKYHVYIEQITSGGYPTTPQALVSQAEYWNTAESRDPVADAKCDATPITAEAGSTQQADITFNGYLDGVQFTPIVSAWLIELSRNGERASGNAEQTIPFFWDAKVGIELLPPGYVVSHSALDRTGQRMLVGYDPDGNGIHEPAIYGKDGTVLLGDLNGNTCGGASVTGSASASGWAMDDTGSKAVGLAYIDRDGDGSCQATNEIVPFVWDVARGMRELPGITTPEWMRAAGISGNGRVIVGTAGLKQALAWVDEGPAINLGALMGVRDLYTANHDGTRVPMYSANTRSMLLWNALRGTGPEAFTDIDGMRYCRDVRYLDFGEDACERYGAEYMYEQLGVAPMGITDITDAGDVIIGRAGGYFTGFAGGIWVEGLGWMALSEFLRKQGVVEAESIPIDSPSGISGSGDEIVGSIGGAQFTWLIQLGQVYVCKNGRSMQVPFPNVMRARLAAGARFGRCEFL